MAKKSESVNFKLNIDGKQALSALKSVAGALKTLSDSANKGNLTKAGMRSGLEGVLQSANKEIKSLEQNAQQTSQQAGSAFQQLGQKLKDAIGEQTFTKLKGGFTKMKDSIVNGTRQMVATFGTLRNVLSQGIDAVRQITQGFLSMGRALTFFIAIPVTAFLKSAIDEARDFEAQMFRVMKVMKDASPLTVDKATGKVDYSDIYKDVSGFIREIASVSGSSQQQFGQWAEELAQFGVESMDALKSYLPIMEMFSQSTDVSAGRVVTALGNIANAFGYSMATGGKEVEDFVWRMANTINKLENVTGANAEQIIIALEDAGPTLSMLEVPPEVIASWAALGVEAGLSANEVGTGLRNLGSFMARNYEKMFETGGALEETFGTLDDLRQAMADDFAGVFTTLIEAYADEEDRVKAIGELYQFLGMRAGRLGAALASQAAATEAYETRMQSVMRMSREEWQAAMSLGDEYADMQGSLAFQSQKLKNNISNLALTVGDSLIPILTKLVQMASPIVKAVTDIFATISDKTRNVIFITSAMIAIGGPLIFFFSQMAFGLSLIASGLLKLGGALGGGIKILGVFGLQLVKLNPIAWLFAGAISSAFNMATEAVGGSVTTISDLLSGLANAMPNMAEGIFTSIGDAAQNAKSAVIDAVVTIANIIASFFEAHSPPDTGPLQHIDKWGETLFDTYLAGFLNADFGILKDVGEYVRGIIESWAAIGKIEDDGTIQAMFLTFREGLAELIANFNETGVISEDMLNKLVSGLGAAADEIKKLIRLNLQLKAIEQQIENIEKRKKEVNKHYREQVRALMTSNLTLSEQADIIERLQNERDAELATLDAEQEVLNEQKDATQEQLNLQEQLLDAYRDQDEIFEQMLAAIEALKDKLGGAAGLGGVAISTPKIDTSSMEKAGAAIAEFGKSLFRIQSQALEVEIVLRGVAIAIKNLFTDGVDASVEGIAALVAGEISADRFGTTISYAFKYMNNLTGGTEEFREQVIGLVKLLGKDTLTKFFNDIATGSHTVDESDNRIKGLRQALGDLDSTTLAALRSELALTETDAADAFTGAQTSADKIKLAYVEIAKVVDPILGKVQALFAGLAGGGAEYDKAYEKLYKFGKEIREIWLVLEEHVPKIVGLVGDIGEKLLKALHIEYKEGDTSSILEGILTAIEKALAFVRDTPIALTIGLALGFNLLMSGGLFPALQALLPLLLKLLKGALPILEKVMLAGGGLLTWITFTIMLILAVKSVVDAANRKAIADGVKTEVQYALEQVEAMMSGGETGKIAMAMALEMPGKPAATPQEIREWVMSQVPEDLLADIPVEARIAWIEGGDSGAFAPGGTGDVLVKQAEHMRVYGERLQAQADAWLAANPTIINPTVAIDTIEDTVGMSEQAIQAWSDRLSGQATRYLEQNPIEIKPAVTLAQQTVTAADITEWSNILNATPEAILAGDIKLDPIVITAPSLSWSGLEEQIKGLVASFMAIFDAELSGKEMILNQAAQQKLVDALLSTFTNAFANTKVEASALTALVMSIAEAMLTALSTDANIQTTLTTLGENMSNVVGTAFASKLFTPDSATIITNIATVAGDLKASGTNLGSGFKEAYTQISSIVSLVSGENFATFVNWVMKLGSLSEQGGLPYAFNQAQIISTNLVGYITGTFMTTLQALIDLFNELMQGNWSIKITYVGSPSTTGTQTSYTPFGGYEPVDDGGGKPGGGGQTGGWAWANRSLVVGETGTELFTPPVSGHITSHSLLSSIMTQADRGTGRKNEYNLQVTGSPVQMSERDLERLMRKMEVLYGG